MQFVSLVGFHFMFRVSYLRLMEFLSPVDCQLMTILLQNVPYQFSTAHLPNCKVKVVLVNLKGEGWIVNSIPTVKVHMCHTLCGGWMAFVRDNNINTGDVCIFELVGKCELRVYILRVGQEGLECQNGKAAVKGSANGCGATSHKNSEANVLYDFKRRYQEGIKCLLSPKGLDKMRF